MPEKDNSNVNSTFPTLKRMSVRHRVGSDIFTFNYFIGKNFVYIINESLRNNLRNTMNLIRILLSCLKKSTYKHLFDSITDYLSDKRDSFWFSQYSQSALDILSSKLGTIPNHQHPSKKPPSNRSPSNCCHINFNNNAIDFINLQKIVHDKDAGNSLPCNLKKGTPIVVREEAKGEILKGIDNCISAWSNKVGLSIAAFRD